MPVHFTTVGHVNSFCKLADVSWLLSFGCQEQPEVLNHKKASVVLKYRLHVYAAVLHFFSLKDLTSKRSSVSSQLCEWIRNAGQCKRQMSVLSGSSWISKCNMQHHQRILSIFWPLLPCTGDYFIIIAWFTCLVVQTEDFLILSQWTLLVLLWRFKNRNHLRVLNTDRIPAAFSQLR